MQNINQNVQLLLNKHRMKHKYWAVAVILSLTVMISVFGSLIMPAMSATEIMNKSSGVDNATLLVGDSSDIKGENVSETIQNANDKYALGIASQFSVFLQNSFKSSNACTDGRMAVGGDLDVSSYSDDEEGYKIGVGHFMGQGVNPYSYGADFDSLNSYSGSYAHAIIGGNVYSKLAVKPFGDENYLRRFAVTDENKIDSSYSLDSDLNRAVYKNESPVINFDSAFTLLKQRSSDIAQIAKKSSNKVSVSGDTVTFTGPGENTTADSVMFNVTADQWEQILNLSDSVTFKFVDIPKLNSPLIGKEVRGSESDGNISVTDVAWENSYIIVNVENSGTVAFPNIPFRTSVNGYWISEGEQNSDDSYPNLSNKFGCSTLLYNFDNAESVKLGGNVQGTILAPDADVTDSGVSDSNCLGHISGGLVAKSFDGCTEFGYRSYTGPITVYSADDKADVNNDANTYSVNVQRVSKSNNPLSGSAIQLWKLSGDGTWNQAAGYNPDGNIKTLDNLSPGKYKLIESTAPDGYDTAEPYYFEIVENSKKAALDEAENETNLSEDSIDFGNWTSYITLDPSQLESIKFGDVIRVYVSGAQSNAQVTIQDMNWNDINDFDYVSVGDVSYVDFKITENNVDTIRNGVFVKGCYASADSVTLISNSDSSSSDEQSFAYVPSVSIKVYSDENFTDEIADLSKDNELSYTADSYYMIDGSKVGSTDLSNASADYGVKIVNQNGKTYFVKNSLAFVPIMNDSLQTFTFMNKQTDSNDSVSQNKSDPTENKTASQNSAKENLLLKINADVTSGSDWFTIENILSNYQYFIKEDLDASDKHIVGGIAVGGNAKIGSGLEGQISPSIVGGTFTHGGIQPGKWSQDYLTPSRDLYDHSNLIDFETAMSAVAKQSKQIADSGLQFDEKAGYVTKSSQWYGDQYTIDLTKLKSKSITIPYSLYSSVGCINFTGVTFEEFVENGYTISITGVGDNEINFNCTSYMSGTKFTLNGNSPNNDIGNFNSEQRPYKKDKQFDLSGFNLIYNFPDATGDINVSYLVGHIVAPYANVTVADGGNHEGGIIAKSLVNEKAEAHFYSYYPKDDIDKFEIPGGITLPETGGIGTTIYYLAGGAVFCASCVGLATKRRKRRLYKNQ